MPAAAPRVQSILVVDDDESFRGLLRTLLEGAGFEVTEAADGDRAMAAAREESPGLVILDVRLPGISGYEVLRQLHETLGDEVPVILISGERMEREDVVAGLLLGAEDYIFKPFHPDELLARVRRSMRGRSGTRTHAGRDTSPQLATLTVRELEVLELLAEGLTQSEIAARLVVSPRTAGTHIQHILSKLDVHSRAHAVGIALRNGLGRGDVGAHAAMTA